MELPIWKESLQVEGLPYTVYYIPVLCLKGFARALLAPGIGPREALENFGAKF